jgi:hypothetical protein
MEEMPIIGEKHITQKPLNQNKMTAVEYLINELSDIIGPIEATLSGELLLAGAIKRAKEMEKEQMEITWNNAIDAELKDKWDSYDDFHKTTFKSE